MHWHVGHTWAPQMAEATRKELYQSWKKAVTRSFNWTDDARADVEESKTRAPKKQD
jgi:glycerol kinase